MIITITMKIMITSVLIESELVNIRGSPTEDSSNIHWLIPVGSWNLLDCGGTSG